MSLLPAKQQSLWRTQLLKLCSEEAGEKITVLVLQLWDDGLKQLQALLKTGTFFGVQKPISCQCTGKPECRPGKDSLRIIKYILAWYLHTGKPPVVCVPFREVTLLIFLKTEEFWELKTYAEGLYLIEFCWSRANTGAFATAFKICRDSWVICAPLKLHQQISVTAVCSSAVTNGVKQALIIFCQMKDIHCSLHW